MKRINHSVLAVALTLAAVVLAALSPLSAPLSGHTIVVGLIVVLAGLSVARARTESQNKEVSA